MFTPYVGVLVDIATGVTAYGSYSEIFRSQANLTTSSGAPLDPATGGQFEVGLKGEYFAGRLQAAIAAFDLRESNRGLVDPANSAFFVGGGEVKSRGFEVEIIGEIRPNFKLSASYTYNDLEFVVNRDASGRPLNEGLSFQSRVPEHLLKTFASYEFERGPLAGLSFGGGVSYQSETASGVSGVIVRQGALTTVDVRAAYKVSGRTEISLNVNNLTDEVYYSRLNTTGNGNLYGEPRSWIVTLRQRF